MYFQNRCSHTTLGKKTLEEVFTGTRPDVSHIRIFGSVCYCHVHADTRKKLDPSGEKGLLVGYRETLKAYIVYILARKMIIVSRDVKFDEDRALRRSMDIPAEQQPSHDTEIKLESQMYKYRYRYIHMTHVLVVKGSQVDKIFRSLT